jgi:hypothetical protein
VFPPGTACPGRRFRIYDGDPSVTYMIPVLHLRRDGDAVGGGVTSLQPHPVANPDGSFDDAMSYCGVFGGYAALRDGRWRTWIDTERAYRPR